jgi:hypothetical protein
LLLITNNYQDGFQWIVVVVVSREGLKKYSEGPKKAFHAGKKRGFCKEIGEGFLKL